MALLSISEPGENQVKAPIARKRALGIDLGTTNSLVAESSLKVLADDDGRFLLPSVVRYLKDGSTVVGHDACIHSNDDAENTIASIKRLMGRGLADINYDLPYEIVPAGDSGMPLVKTCAGEISPVQVSAEILKSLAARGKQALGGEIDGVVITVPAYFDEAQRQATKDAARIAGLEVLRLLSEPTAAAVAYGLDARLEGTVIIYDLGGGTFDVSLMQLQKGVFEVLATGGDTALGGDDFDRAIAQWILREKDQGVALEKIRESLTPSQLNELNAVARAAKHGLTDAEQVEINFGAWTGTLSRQTLNDLIDGLIDQTLKACRRVLRDAKLNIDDIDDVVMVGGSTRSPRVREKVSELFKQELLTSIDPDQVVAMGAAIQADVLVGNKYGDDLLLLDVIPLSLGLETMGGLMEKVIPRNTTIPVARAQEFTTFKDGQTVMSLHVLQGERELVDRCRSLAKFELRGIPPMVAGAAVIRVAFQVDADGLLTVQAQEVSSGVESTVVVKPSFGLADGQVEQMIKASFEQAQSDKDSRSLREAQVEALRIVEALESALAVDGSLLSAKQYKELNTAVLELKDILQGDDGDAIKCRAEALNDLSMNFAALRMDSQIKTALAGKSIQELDS